MEMEGQGQPRGEESEFRELLAQMQEIIREVGELEERWQGLNPKRRRAEGQEIEESYRTMATFSSSTSRANACRLRSENNRTRRTRSTFS